MRSKLDVRNWSSNQKNSGCLPPERAWLNAQIGDDGGSDGTPSVAKGWLDTYRALHPQGQDYTWWSNRGAARANDVGWRIDYQLATPSLKPKRCAITATPRFSDHAPYLVEYAPIKNAPSKDAK